MSLKVFELYVEVVFLISIRLVKVFRRFELFSIVHFSRNDWDQGAIENCSEVNYDEHRCDENASIFKAMVKSQNKPKRDRPSDHSSHINKEQFLSCHFQLMLKQESHQMKQKHCSK